jgi:hypothetical protein
MPPQQRVGRRDRGDLPQSRTTHPVRSCGRSAAIVVRETHSLPTKLTPKKPVFFDRVRDGLPLAAVHPATEHSQHHLQRHGVEHEAELASQAGQTDVG